MIKKSIHSFLIIALIILCALYGISVSQPISPPLNVQSDDGTVTNYPYSLHVTPTPSLIDNSDGTMMLKTNASSTYSVTPAGSTYSLQYHASGSTFGGSNNLMFYSASSTPSMYIDGNVGIGTSTPSRALDLVGSMVLQNTTSSDTGIIYKNNDRFIHNFQHPTGDTAIPDGHNTFIGVNAGNFTMGSTALNTTSSSYNIGIGENTLSANTIGYRNIAVGQDTLSKNTMGYFNIAVGYKALANNTVGFDNVAIGYRALENNTFGTDNLAIGMFALRDNNGNGNTAFGKDALSNNTSGAYNTALGNGAMYYNTTSTYNTAVGVDALKYNTTGEYNTGIGVDASMFNTTASYNTSLGVNALFWNQTGQNNTVIGYAAGVGTFSNSYSNNSLFGYGSGYSLSTGSNNVFLGYQAGYAETTGSNKLYIANTSTTAPLILGDFATTSPSILFNGSATSTGRFTAPSGSILNMTSTSIESGSMTTTARFTADSGSILNMTSTNTTSTHIYSTTTTATNMAITGLTSRSIPFIGTGGSVSENTNFVWDNFGSPGRMGVGTSTPKAPFEAMRGTKVTAPIGTNTSDVFKAINYSDNNTVSRAGLFLTHDTQSVNNGNALFAFNAFVYKDTTVNNTATIGYVAGSYAIRMTSVATGGNVKGMAALVTNITPYSNYSATITSAYSLLAEGHTIGTSAGTIVNAIGIQQKAHSSSGSGAIRKAYGMVLDNQTAGTTINANLLIGTTPSVGNYSIYNNSTYDNYFLGSLGIASTTPSSLFATHGTATMLSVTTTRINASDYYSRDGSKGITDNTSYWLCTAADCSTKCQVTIKNGLITGCP